MFIWAHRGASGRAPENTMAAFMAAEEDGAGGIELDVHLTSDGTLAVIHDETLHRTTDSRGRVADCSMEELRRLDAGSWFSPAFANERIPRLEEVLDWAGGRLRLNIEIKAAAAGRAVLKTLEDYPQAQVLVSSFNGVLLEEMHVRCPQLPLGFLTDSRYWRRTLERAAACGAINFHPAVRLVTGTLIAACRQAGLQVVPWTVDEPSRARTLAQLGVQGLFTNQPALMARLFEE